MNRFLVLLIVSFILMSAALAFAGNQASHNVNINIPAINNIAVAQPDLYISITSPEAGDEPDPVTEQAGKLLWTTNQTNRKITVSTPILIETGIQVQVRPINVFGGIGLDWIVIDQSDRDVVTEISKVAGRCDLRYRVTATTEADPGDYSVNVLYTLTTN